MARKKWTAKEKEYVTQGDLRFREKRKWQIALRRYVLEKNFSIAYAPYFGLDIEYIRKWFESQFTDGLGWRSFGVSWQFDHIIPVAYFDFSQEEDLKLCWNFVNLRVEASDNNKSRGQRLDLLAAKEYFQKLYEVTSYPICLKMLDKIEKIKLSELLATEAQVAFLLQNKEYLDYIRDYSSIEFELLNRGRSIEEVKKEIDFIKNLKFS
ncbi:MAG: hypothetical protein JSU05_02320 [Bacteroidetes bacterium]|nr:hypothetical protein [Bacteroidota bacterium]